MAIDQAVAMQVLEAVSDRAVEAAIFAAEQVDRSKQDVAAALERDLEGTRYDASLAARRYELVDPAKRHVARELEARWNAALERVHELENKLTNARSTASARPRVDRALLLKLAADLPSAWNAPTTDMRSKQRLIHILVKEIILDLDENTHEAVLLIHWTGGRHSELRVRRRRSRGYPADLIPSAVDVLRRLAGHWPDRELATTLNRVRCKTSDGETWSTVRVREMRERLGLPECKAPPVTGEMISLMKAAQHLGISVGSAKALALKGILPASQIMPGSPWMVSSSALGTEEVKIGVRAVIDRRPKFYEHYQYEKTLPLPGL